MVKGNIVKSKEHDTHGIVIAVRKDGKAACVHVFGRSDDVWKAADKMVVTVDGLMMCDRCGGSGVYKNGDITGICFRCEGKGKQSNEDRIRNYYYDLRQARIEDALDAIEQGEEPPPLSYQMMDKTPLAPVERPKIRHPKSTKKNHPDPERKVLDKPKANLTPAEAKEARRARRKRNAAIPTDTDSAPVIDCKGCNTVHREDTMCPW